MNEKTRRAKFDAVIRQLGGVTAVSLLLNRSLQSVCNWRRNGAYFPSVLADDIRKVLKRRGCPAPPSEIFRMENNLDADAA